MPIDAFLFGGRRATVVPLVTEAFDWEHGVFLGAIMGSEKTAAAAGAVGELRFDPMAMLPFCGYNMADYFGALARDRRAADGAKLPRIFMVNWFRKDEDGQVPVAGLRREQPRARLGLPSAATARAEAEETPIGLRAGRGRAGHRGARPVPRPMAKLLRRGPRGVEAPAARRSASTSRGSATAAARAARAARALEKRLTQSESG